LLGEDYPGYFEMGDTQTLSGLLLQAETDYTFLAELKSGCKRLAANFDPKRESHAWADLLDELV